MPGIIIPGRGVTEDEEELTIPLYRGKAPDSSDSTMVVRLPVPASREDAYANATVMLLSEVLQELAVARTQRLASLRLLNALANHLLQPKG